MAHLDRLALALGFVAIALAAGCGSVKKAGTNTSIPNGLTPLPVATRVAVLELGQFDGERNSCIFGFDVDSDTLATARRTLEAERVDVVIIRVKSDGGERSECLRIANELEGCDSQFRTVLFVNRAVVNAAIAVWSVDEIYMEPHACLGAAMVWPGRPITRAYIDDLLAAFDVASALGERDPRPLRAMLNTGVPLSATRIGSKVELFGDETSGEFLINRGSDLLCLNAISAYNAGVSQGTVHDVPSLLKQIGIANAEFVGDSANEDLQREARLRIATVERINSLTWQALAAVTSVEQMADGAPIDVEFYWPAHSRATSLMARLKKLVHEQPVLAGHSVLAYADDGPRDVAGVNEAIAEVTRRLDAAHQRAFGVTGSSSK